MIEFARAPAWLEDIEERRFVCWGWRDSPSGKPTKPPLKPNGAPASTSDARTWRTLPVVLKALEKQDTIDDKKLDGIGYVLTQDDRHIAFDLDHCRDPKKGTLLPWARELLARLDTYTELTPSGEGARAIGTAPPVTLSSTIPAPCICRAMYGTNAIMLTTAIRPARPGIRKRDATISACVTNPNSRPTRSARGPMK